MPREENLQFYYPSARVRLIVRLEDFGAGDVPKPPAKPPHRLKGTKDQSDKLRTVNEDGRIVLLGQGDDPTSLGSPQQQQSSSDQRTFVLDGLLPQQATLARNGIRQGGTLNVTLSYADMPFDPRVIRSCAIEFYLGCVTPEDYQRGIAGERRADATPAGALAYHIVPDEYVDGHGRPRTNLRFQGWVDEWEAEFPEGDVPAVRLTCTDNTRLLIDQDAPPKLAVGVEKAIDEAVAEYLSNFPQFRGLAVEYRPHVDRSKIPVLKDSLARTKYQPALGPTPSGGGLKVWDYLTDVTGSIGHVVYFDGTSIVIQRARTLYDGALPPRPGDPFVGRVLPTGRTLTRRLFIYGRNIADLAFNRKFTTNVPENIEVRSYDTASKKTVVARFPVAEGRQSKPLPGDANSQKWKVIRITGVKDQATLQVVAQTVYEQLGRSELGVRLTTKNLASFGGDGLDPDALDLVAGDAVDIEVLREPTEGSNTVQSIEDRVKTRAADYLRALGYGDRLASAYQSAVQNIGLPTTFRVRAVSYEWSNEEGVSIDMDLVNFVEVRSDKELPDETAIKPSDVADAAEGGGPLTVVIKDNIDDG